MPNQRVLTAVNKINFGKMTDEQVERAIQSLEARLNDDGDNGILKDLTAHKREFCRRARLWTGIYYIVGGLSVMAAAVAGLGALNGMSAGWAGAIALTAAGLGAIDKFLGAGKVMDRKQAVADRAIEELDDAKVLRANEGLLRAEYTARGYLAYLCNKVEEYDGFGPTEQKVWESMGHRPSLVHGR